jgi:hypothetical protein
MEEMITGIVTVKVMMEREIAFAGSCDLAKRFPKEL